jgi:hypothetical protein
MVGKSKYLRFNQSRRADENNCKIRKYSKIAEKPVTLPGFSHASEHFLNSMFVLLNVH